MPVKEKIYNWYFRASWKFGDFPQAIEMPVKENNFQLAGKYQLKIICTTTMVFCKMKCKSPKKVGPTSVISRKNFQRL